MRLPKTLGEWFATISGGITLAVAIVGFYLHLHTDAEAAQEHAEMEHDLQQEIVDLRKENKEVTQALLDSVNRSEILRLQREIDRLTRDNENPNLNTYEKAQNQINIDKYNDIITCIRTGQKYCV